MDGRGSRVEAGRPLRRRWSPRQVMVASDRIHSHTQKSRLSRGKCDLGFMEKASPSLVNMTHLQALSHLMLDVCNVCATHFSFSVVL